MKTYLAVVFLLPLYFVSCFSLASEEVIFESMSHEQVMQNPFGFDAGVSARIVGGQDSDQAYPWMVSIQKGSHFCGGVLIGNNWVLTAAHCLEDVSAEQLTLMIGAENLGSLNGAEFRQASWIQTHHDYQSNRFYSDIAIIKLNRSSAKTPIKIIDQAARNGLTQNEQMRVIGWGLTKEGVSSSFSYDLQQVDVSFQSDSVCRSTYGNLGISDYWDNSFCAGEVSGGKDACQGDSGGPVMVKAGEEWALAGLVSWGSGCAQAGHFGAYTEVAAFEGWIAQRRAGVTVLGPEKIGFLGEGRSKAQTYTIMNLGKHNAVVNKKSIDQSSLDIFEIDESNWLLGDQIPGGYECTFVVNARGRAVGEFNGDIQIDVGGDIVHQAVNSKILNEIDASPLDVDWEFYSGTFGFTEHAQAWSQATAERSVGARSSSFLKSGQINDGQRSVLLSYINGSNNEEPHYLKFDAKVDSSVTSYSVDGLYLYINEERVNPDSLLYAGTSNSWKSYSVELPKGINHVMHLYYKDSSLSSGSDAAYLDNFRVCQDPAIEATCSTAPAYSNSEDLSVIDDPNNTDDWRSVCTMADYQENPIEYASRSSGDASFNDGQRPVGKTAGAGTLFYFLLIIFTHLVRRRSFTAAA